jgi:hypothetical protein
MHTGVESGKGVQRTPRQIFKKYLNKNAIKLLRFCPKSMGPQGFWQKSELPLLPGFLNVCTYDLKTR